jgi:hypothetical protein
LNLLNASACVSHCVAVPELVGNATQIWLLEHFFVMTYLPLVQVAVLFPMHTTSPSEGQASFVVNRPDL